MTTGLTHEALDEVRDILAQYDDGLITDYEAVIKIVERAGRKDVADAVIHALANEGSMPFTEAEEDEHQS